MESCIQRPERDMESEETQKKLWPNFSFLVGKRSIFFFFFFSLSLLTERKWERERVWCCNYYCFGVSKWKMINKPVPYAYTSWARIVLTVQFHPTFCEFYRGSNNHILRKTKHDHDFFSLSLSLRIFYHLNWITTLIISDPWLHEIWIWKEFKKEGLIYFM